jgi:hypothetical protein
MFGYGAAAALLVSFAALGLLWPRARWHDGAPSVDIGPAVGTAVGIGAGAVRLVGVVMFVTVATAALAGPAETQENVAPFAIFVGLWIGVALLSAIAGDVWRLLSPFAALAAAGRRLGVLAAERGDYRWGAWPAAAGLFGFVWLELVYPHRADPRHLGVAILVYAATVVVALLRWGTGWLPRGETFAVYFGLLARIAPLHVEAGRLRVRPPLAGLAGLDADRSLAAVVLVALGSTTFDGLARTQPWIDRTAGYGPWAGAAVATFGLVWAIAVVAMLYVGAVAVAGRLTGRPTSTLVEAFVHSLVPIALAYGIAHYFSLLVFEGQIGLARLSDPFGAGWNLFGTADWTVNFLLVSTTTIAWVQAASIVAGHIGGVVLAHDRALALFARRDATRSQYPLLLAMIAYTVGGLALLLGG